MVESQTRLIEELIERTLPPEQGAHYYVVQRTAIMKAAPSPRSKVVAKIFPTQKVVLRERRGKYILVSYFDYSTLEEAEGWVLKKYLKAFPTRTTTTGESHR